MNTKNKIFLILFLVFSVASFSFGASSQQAVFVPNSNLPTGNPSGQIIIKSNDQLNNSPLQDQALNFTLNVQSPTPLTLNLSTDKSEYQVGESAKYTISGSALPQNSSNYQTITATIYAVSYPQGRGGCANGCAITFTYLNNSWTGYSNQFTSSDVGNWTVYVKYNNTQSNNVNYSVQSPTPLTLNLSTDKSEYQVGESAKYTISGTALPQNPSNGQTITATIYAVAYPQGRDSCANGCNIGFTYLNNSWTGYSSKFTSSDVGNWTVRVTYNNTQSNDVSYTVLSPQQPPPNQTPTSTANLTINGVTSGSFRVGDSWTLKITSNLPNKEVTICAKPPSPTGDSCTPAVNLGFSEYTDSNGNWTANGTFGSDVVGTWKEYAKVGTTNSNYIDFTVSTGTQSTFWIFPASSTLSVGDVVPLEAYYDPDGPSGPQTETIVTDNSDWSSSNPSVATVGNNTLSFFTNKGYVASISQGQATITATYNNLTAQATVNVSSGTQTPNPTPTPTPNPNPTPTPTPNPTPTSYNLTVNISPVGAGTVNVDPPKNNINSTATFSYSTSTPVTLKIVSSSPGYVFQGWQGDCSGTNTTCSITVNSNKTVTAVFKTQGTIREIIPFRPPSLNEFLKQTASIFFGWR